MDFSNKKCVPCEGGLEPLNKNEAETFMKNIPGWNSLSKMVEKGSEKNWYLITEGSLQDTSWVFFHNDRAPLGYSFKKNITKTSLSFITKKTDFFLQRQKSMNVFEVFMFYRFFLTI